MAHSTDFLMVHITCPTDQADVMAQTLVERRLAACVNIIGPARSVYRWQDRVERGRESMLLIKTRRDRYAALEDAVRALHRYELPEIIAVEISCGSMAYLDWIKISTE